MPAALTGTTGTITGATGDLTIGHYVTDMVASHTHAGATNTWTLDPNQRLRRAVLLFAHQLQPLPEQPLVPCDQYPAERDVRVDPLSIQAIPRRPK